MKSKFISRIVLTLLAVIITAFVFAGCSREEVSSTESKISSNMSSMMSEIGSTLDGSSDTSDMSSK